MHGPVMLVLRRKKSCNFQLLIITSKKITNETARTKKLYEWIDLKTSFCELCEGRRQTETDPMNFPRRPLCVCL